MNAPRIRPLGPDDAAAFQAIRLRALRDHPQAFGSSVAEERQLPLTTVADRLTADATRAVFGAERDGVLVGTIGIYRETRPKLLHKGGIWGMYVAPEARRAGVGHALIAAALAFARARPGWTHVTLRANAANDAAQALYRAHGFVVYGREPAALQVDGVLHDEVLMIGTVHNPPD